MVSTPSPHAISIDSPEITVASGAGAPGHTKPPTVAEARLTRPLTFTFEYCGIGFRGHTRRLEDRAWVTVCGNLGPVPYSAESPSGRTGTLQTLDDARRSRRGRFLVSPDKSILVGCAWKVPLPVSPEDALAGIAIFLLAAKPYFDSFAAHLARAQER